MSIPTFDSPLISYWYTDGQGNKVSVLRVNKTYKVINNKIFLLDIPDKLIKINFLTINSTTLY
ncbi:MAG: hypothetical protein WCX96_02825, partial [Bacilli bacterium]